MTDRKHLLCTMRKETRRVVVKKTCYTDSVEIQFEKSVGAFDWKNKKERRELAAGPHTVENVPVYREFIFSRVSGVVSKTRYSIRAQRRRGRRH